MAITMSLFIMYNNTTIEIAKMLMMMMMIHLDGNGSFIT
jgi:hypothetical protein